MSGKKQGKLYKGGQKTPGGGMSLGRAIDQTVNGFAKRQTGRSHDTNRRTGQGGNSGRGGR